MKGTFEFEAGPFELTTKTFSLEAKSFRSAQGHTGPEDWMEG